MVYLPKGKAFTFAQGEDVNFVKADNTCTLLSVQDGADYEFPNVFKATKAVYNKYNVLCQMALTTAMMIMKFHFQHWIETTLCRRTATFPA